MTTLQWLDVIAARSGFDTKNSVIHRVLHGKLDHCEGVWADKFGPLCVINVYGALSENDRVNLLIRLKNYAVNGAHWILKIRALDKTEFECIFSSDDLCAQVFIAAEAAVQFQIRCDPRHDFGVFTDARFARTLIRNLCENGLKSGSPLSLLNLFAYTCGFGLVASKAGARKVVNVDPNRDYLSWGKENAVVNAVDFSVVPETAQKYLRRLVSRKQKGVDVDFDCIVIDPPAFGVGRGAERLLRTLWPEILEAVVLLKPKHLFLMFNDLYLRKTKNVREMVEKNLGQGWKANWYDSEGNELNGEVEIDRKLRNPDDGYFAPPILAHFETV